MLTTFVFVTLRYSWIYCDFVSYSDVDKEGIFGYKQNVICDLE